MNKETKVNVYNFLILSKVFIYSFIYLTGVGVGFVYVPVASIPSYYFSRYLNIVSGISASGAGFGTLLYSVIVPNSLQTYSLRGTFFVLAGISAHMCLFAALCRPNKIEKEKHKKNNDSYTDDRIGYLQLLKNLPLLIFCLSIFCWSMGVSIVLIFLPMYCQHFGSTDQQTAMVFSFIGGANILSRILTGIAANADNISELSLYVGSFGISGIASLLLPLYAQTFTGQLVYGIIQSLHTGGVYACLNSINIRLVGISHVAMATGLEMFFCGSGLLVGPPLGGKYRHYKQRKHESNFDFSIAFTRVAIQRLGDIRRLHNLFTSQVFHIELLWKSFHQKAFKKAQICSAIFLSLKNPFDILSS